jgi:hypothetical protein
MMHHVLAIFFGERAEQGFCPLFVLDASGFIKFGSFSSRTDQG